MGIPLDAVVLISVGDLNRNKNNRIVIKALNEMNDNNIHYILCGEGPWKKKLKRMSDLEHVHFLGMRADISELLTTSDIFIISSFREGLSRSLMEAMASGLPCIVSDIRGNRDLIEEGKGGFLFEATHAKDVISCIKRLDHKTIRSFGDWNQKRIEYYRKSRVIRELISIYHDCIYRG